MSDSKITEKLKYIVIYMHVSALLLCTVCYPAVFWQKSNLQIAIPMFVISAIVSGYSFIRQTIFLFKYPVFQKRRRVISEIVLYSCCICFALVIGIISLFCNFKLWALAAFFILKIYFLLFATLTMAIMTASAHKINLICVKLNRGGEASFNDAESKNLNSSAILAALSAGIAGIVVQFVGTGNVLYYFLCLPFMVAAFALFVICFAAGVRCGAFDKKSLIKAITGAALAVISVILPHLFANAGTVVEYEKLNFQFEIYTFVMIPVVTAVVAALILFGKNIKRQLL